MFTTPILMIIFNRTDCLQRVFERVRGIRPARLYVAADAPREKYPEEGARCAAARKVILEHIDWECKVFTHIREENRGCGIAVSQAVSWFFEQESEGIVLEDDCLVSESFFPYAQELLEKYRNDERIGVISALNAAGSRLPCRHSYFFTRTFGLWGWASWRRVWQSFDLDCGILEELESNHELFFTENPHELWALLTSLKGIYEIGGYNTWDYQFAFANLIQNRLCIVPKVNMVHNLGYDAVAATHVPQRVLHEAASRALDLSFPLVAPPYVMPNLDYEAFYRRHILPKMLSMPRRMAGALFRKLAGRT